LKASWSKGKDFETISLSEKELKEIKSAEVGKYRTWEWTFSRSPKFTFKNKKRFTGGAIEVNLEISEGIIKDCVINGDFLALIPVSEVEKLLIGMKYDVQSIRDAVNSLPVHMYFGDISFDEIIGCFFDQRNIESK